MRRPASCPERRCWFSSSWGEGRLSAEDGHSSPKNASPADSSCGLGLGSTLGDRAWVTGARALSQGVTAAGASGEEASAWVGGGAEEARWCIEKFEAAAAKSARRRAHLFFIPAPFARACVCVCSPATWAPASAARHPARTGTHQRELMGLVGRRGDSAACVLNLLSLSHPSPSPSIPTHSRRKRPLTAAEQAEVADARARAAAAAEARQRAFNKTAVGRAQAKAVADARKPAAGGPADRNDRRAQDWLS